MSTVSTLDTSALLVTAATGSITGATLRAVASSTTTSACLPGVSEPVRSSTPATWAPLMVASSSIWRAVSMSSATSPSLPASQPAALTRARSQAKAARIWVNMSPGAVVTTSMDRLGRSPYSIDLSTGDQPPLVGGQVAAVDVGGVRPQQAQVAELPDHAEAAGRVHGHVDGDGDAELAGQGPLGPHDLVAAVGRAAGGQGQGEQAVAGGEVGVADPAHVVGRDGDLAVVPVVVQGGVGAAVGVLGADPGVPEALDAGVGVVGGVVDVRPVDQGRDAGVDALQRPGQVAGVDVLGPVQGGEGVEDLHEVGAEGGVGGAATDGRLPGMAVGVDEPGDDDPAAGVHHLGVGVDLGGDLGDRVPLDEDVALRQVAEVGIHGQDGAATQQEPVGHWDSSSSKSDLMWAGA